MDKDTMLTLDAKSMGHAPVQSKQTKGTSQIGLQSGWTRVTFILKEEHLKNIKTRAKEKRITIKKLLHIIMTEYLLNYQKNIDATTIEPSR